MNTEEQVEATVERWRAAMERSDAQTLKSLWAQSHPRLSYLPTEVATHFTTFAEISDYYDHLCSVINVREWRSWDVDVDVIAPGVAFAHGFTSMLFCPAGAQPTDELGYWQGRTAFTMIQQSGEWKFIHYEDSTLMHYLLPVAQKCRDRQAERCIAHITAGEADKCIPILEEMLRPHSLLELARANGNRSMAPRRLGRS